MLYNFSLFLAESSIFVFVRCFASPKSENGGGCMFFVCFLSERLIEKLRKKIELF